MAISVGSFSNNLPTSNTNQERLSTSFEQLSSAKKINSAADDAAGLAISTRANAQISSTDKALNNLGDAVSYNQTASGALSQVTDNLQRVRELSVQSANGTLTDQDRAGLQKEADMLLTDTRTILEESNFNGNALFSGDSAQIFQIGPNAGDQLQLDSSNLAQQFEDLQVSDINISTSQGSSNALATLDQALSAVSSAQGEIGAVTNRLESAIEQTQTSQINAAEANSRITDTDFAKASTDRATVDILNQVQLAMRAQANKQDEQVLQLLTF